VKAQSRTQRAASAEEKLKKEVPRGILVGRGVDFLDMPTAERIQTAAQGSNSRQIFRVISTIEFTKVVAGDSTDPSPSRPDLPFGLKPGCRLGTGSNMRGGKDQLDRISIHGFPRSS